MAFQPRSAFGAIPVVQGPSVYELAGGAIADVDGRKASTAATLASVDKTRQDIRLANKQENIFDEERAKKKAEQEAEDAVAGPELDARFGVPEVAPTPPEAPAQAAAPTVAAPAAQTFPVAPAGPMTTRPLAEGGLPASPEEPTIEAPAPMPGQAAQAVAPAPTAPSAAAPDTPPNVAAASPDASVDKKVAAQVKPLIQLTPEQQDAMRKVAAMPDKVTVEGQERPNPMANGPWEARRKAIYDTYKSGKINAVQARKQIAGLDAAQQANAKAGFDMLKIYAETEEKLSVAAKNRAEVGKVEAEAREKVEGLRFNYIDDVMHVFKTQGAEAAQTMIDANNTLAGINITDPKTRKKLEGFAARSPQAKERDKTASGKPETSGLPDGFSRTFDPQTRQWTVLDANGSPATQAQIEAASLKGKKAGASNTTINTGTSGVGQPIPPGGVPLAKIDAKDQIDAGKGQQDAQQVIDAANTMKTLFNDALREAGIDQSQTGWGKRFRSWVAENGNNPAVQQYNVARQQLVNNGLRQNKGSQTEGDAIRELSAGARLDLTPEAHDGVINQILSKANRSYSFYTDIQRGYTQPGAREASQQPAGLPADRKPGPAPDTSGDPFAAFKRK